MKEFVIQYKKINQKLFDYLTSIVLSSWMIAILILWSFLEASIWPIFPEFILVFFIILSPKNYRKLFLISFVSSILGVASFFLFAHLFPAAADNLLMKVPLVNKNMLLHIDILYQNGGTILVVKQPFSAIPIKVWTFMAAKNSIGFLPFMLLVSLIRGIRFFILAFFGSIIGAKLKKSIRGNFLLFIVTYIAIFLLLWTVLSFTYTLYL